MKEKTDLCGECWSCGGCHCSNRCKTQWTRQLRNTVQQFVQVRKCKLWIVSKVCDIMGQVRTEEDKAARPTCSQGCGVATTETDGGMRRRAGVCPCHCKGEAAEGKDWSSKAKRRDGEGGGGWGRRHVCVAETG